MNRSGNPAAVILYAVFFFFLAALPQAQGKMYYKRTTEQYNVPDVILINQEGKEVPLKSFLDSEKLIVLDFIYGTCTTICPILSVGFAHFQKELGPGVDRVQLVSISIDPDNDTPELMRAYLQRYGAQPGWDILTGKRDNIVAVLTEFDAYVTNKMNHFPLTILHAPGSDTWIRLDGLLSASDIMKEYNKLAK
ncbi:MAG: SCO family protein [Thermodesulfobacteriota bacterium]|nr:SCO family protein [Thermodesulfobacteriota bacterium]